MTLETKLSRPAVRDIVLSVLSRRFGIPIEKLTKPGRRAEQVSAKRAAIWFLVVRLHHPNRITAKLLGYADHTTVTNHAVELRRKLVSNTKAYADIEKEIVAKFAAAETTSLETNSFWTPDKRAAMTCLWQRTPMTPEQIARALGCTTDTVNKSATAWDLMSDDFPVLNPYDDDDFDRLLNRKRDFEPHERLSFWTPPRAATLFALLKYTEMTMQQIGSALGCDHTRLWQIAERLGAFPDNRRAISNQVNTTTEPSPAVSQIG